MYQKPLVTIELDEYLAMQKYIKVLEGIDNPFKTALETFIATFYSRVHPSPSIYNLQDISLTVIKDILDDNNLIAIVTDDKVLVSIKQK